MEIRELNLKSYGKFREHRIAFEPGLNIIYGDNESGKTTIHSFVRAMVFGQSRGRGKAARTDEYQLRQPWEAPGAYLGSMRIEEDGEIYRIDRCFDRSSKPLDLVNETRSQESEDPELDLDALLGGISETAFVNSVFIPQSGAATDEELAQELRRYMINSEGAMDGGLDVSQALESLRKKKKKFEQQKKKEDEALEREISETQAKADQLRGELELLKRQAASGDAAAEQTLQSPAFKSGREEEQEEEEDEEPVSEGMKRLLYVLLFLAGALSLAGAVLMTTPAIRTFLAVFAVVFWLLLFVTVFLFRPERDAAELDAGERVQNCPPALLKEIRSREERSRVLSDRLESLYAQHTGNDGTNAEIAALDLAIDRICELSDGIFRVHGGELSEIASGILSEITEGRYKRIVVDDTGRIRIHTPSRVLGPEQLGGGTLQQIYFALRMAAGELFSQDVRLPVILDEPFAMYDDARLAATLKWLRHCGRQVILFSCQTRERELLEKI